MPQISRDEYTAEDQARYDAANKRLWKIISSEKAPGFNYAL